MLSPPYPTFPLAGELLRLARELSALRRECRTSAPQAIRGSLSSLSIHRHLDIIAMSDGKPTVVATVGPGDVLGEVAFIDDSPVAMCELLVERIRDTARRV